MGNGMLGTYIVYEEDCNSMRFEVCRSDVHDHRAERERGKEMILYETSEEKSKYSPAETSETDDK